MAFWNKDNQSSQTLSDLIRGLQHSVNAAMEMIETRNIPVLKIADMTSISKLIELYGNKESGRLFEKEDYFQYLLNCHMKKERCI